MSASGLLGLRAVEDAELGQLFAQATAKRDAYWGAIATYSRKVFIPLTNLCRDSCGYCTFVKQPGESGAGYLSPEEVLRVASRGEELGCKEALFSLGEKPELRYPQARDMLASLGYRSTIDYVIAMCELVISNTSLIPHVNAGTMSRDELKRVKEVSGSAGLMLENVSRRLIGKGMPHYACPDKVPLQRLRTLDAAGEASVPMTTGILIGIGETWDERIESLQSIVDIHERHGHIQEVIVQNFRAKLGTAMATHREPDMTDMLRTLAIARLMLPVEISLQAPPNLNEAFERYLDAGINDWGGVSPLTADHINPECAWPAVEEIAFRTKQKGMRLVERLTTYPLYLRQPEKYLRPVTHEALRRLAREDGYAAHQAHADAS
ncbi:7,8-didemethyl-8-hydroxy-5-deazariboflavin synthase subunit CofG [Bradyrhizobium sacchari]|uniref:7,8-didemethyl-8-hydroxy-5-deazariboflavin synthase n=1 Tax=Bradyrhizobium sacchari TaxID=1399419 RepID=A0A560JFY4_9BRAD|nr:7,8-didemethyl-8-hydroxy-5-deazariboflavin synthase CofG [Bradyrhizobium sacchari]OPY96643.1 7,8-didemethyl-8-hydroxy-5-deazariboflavin synthase subunit CofG [Bradyrhizobium sacchari]TWB51195.1 FO synthase subunit 1 [Bradyrhizobium sacchari]TWB69429.1 FO synthase subunit 1 [Bradyrhizobium sacchari]